MGTLEFKAWLKKTNSAVGWAAKPNVLLIADLLLDFAVLSANLRIHTICLRMMEYVEEIEVLQDV